MPRKTRMYVPGIPTHVVQRGHNRAATFFCDADYRYYKCALAEGLLRYGAKLHAYCLMTNHVHLLLTPDETDSVSRIMQHIGRTYVCHMNGCYQRSGALWEGRHKSSLVDAGHYLLATYRYIELNPVAAGMVRRPEDYLWSSYGANGLGTPDELVAPHAEYLALAFSRDRVIDNYRALMSQALTSDDIGAISATLKANYPLGNDRFRQSIEQALGKRIGRLKVGGRPGS